MENISIQDAKILCENGLISQEELLVFMQMSTNNNYQYPEPDIVMK